MINLSRKVNEKHNKLITFEEMHRHPIGEEVQIMPGVRTQRLKSRYGLLFFKVIQDEGTVIPDNFHDCVEEIVIDSGELLEEITNTHLNKYDGMTIPKGKSHRTRAIKDSVWFAHIYKNK